MTTNARRGGRRAGAGAPPGNNNALRTGRYVADPALRRALARLPARDRDTVIAALKGRPPASAAPSPLRILQLRPSVATAAAPEQSNASPQRQTWRGDLDGLAFRLTAQGFFGAAPFLRTHYAEASTVEQVLEHLEQLRQEEPREYDAIRNKGAFLRAMIHQLSARMEDGLMYCQHCAWGHTAPAEERGNE